MGLMDGLSHWLRQIIAVVLLVSIVDLILPNRTMQKYVRLVAGLFILMTVATPIMNWVKGDFSDQLAASLNVVERTPAYAADELAMIEMEGAKLRENQSIQATDMVKTKLEAAIASEVEQSEQRAVRSVNVQWQHDTDGALIVEEVVVLLEAEQEQTELSTSPVEVQEVSLIEPIAIEVNVDGLANEDAVIPVTSTETEAYAADGSVVAVSRDTQLRVVSLLTSQFGIAGHNIVVKQVQDPTIKPR